MRKIAVYGKGGIGKSTISSSISYSLASRGRRVLHVGCDPKHDSTLSLIQGRYPTTLAELLIRNQDIVTQADLFVTPGKLGIDLIESGGPEPGIGCAGRGIARMLEIFEDLGVLERGYDLALFDILGDVVCGGFAAPLRQGYADAVIIVVSEEIMAIYAANNIARAVRRFQRNGVRLGGLVINRRDNSAPFEMLESFAARIKAPILARIPRENRIREAETHGLNPLEFAPDSEIADRLHALADRIMSLDTETLPTPDPMTDEQFRDFVAQFSTRRD